MKEAFYITTPIYYPSGKYHIGTAYTTIATDVLARHKRLAGFDVRFLTGNDEHGQKIETKAMEAGLTPKEYTDKIADDAKSLWNKLNITNDDFIRTTEERHKKVVEKVFEYFLKNGDIYKGNYSGLYCLPCESYYKEKELIDGKCPDCNREVNLVEEECYFFNMKKYVDRLKNFYDENPLFLVPTYKKNEIINNFINKGLEDLCVSRTTFDWGIKLPFDDKHVAYVWVDALTNYISALGYLSDDDSLFKKYWPANVHIIGKDIIRFHAIYWPIFLMALELPLPKKLFVHDFIMMKDGKMSKSKGNVIYPDNLIDRYGVDPVRYTILKSLPYGGDGEYTPEFFIEKYNYDLCNDLGNLLNRTISMVNKYHGGNVSSYLGQKNTFDSDLESFVLLQVGKTFEALENLEFSNSLSELWKIISRANKYVDETCPWNLAKDDSKAEELKSVMNHLVETLRIIAVLLQSFLPNTANSIFEDIGVYDDAKTYESIKKYGLDKELVVSNDPKILFNRLDVESETEAFKNF